MSNDVSEVDTRLAELAARIDCLTECDVAYLAGVKLGTLLVWRKRGEGPPWVRIGNEILYPRSPFQQHIERQASESAPTSRAACL